jgi:hypothetical protein
MSNVSQRRSREANRDTAQTQRAAEKHELREQLLQAARNLRVSDRAHRLLVELLKHSNLAPERLKGGATQPRHWQTPRCDVLRVWPDRQTLADKLGWSLRKVGNALAELEKTELIQRVRRAGGFPGQRTGANRSSLTLLMVPTPERMPAPRLRVTGTVEELAASLREDEELRKQALRVIACPWNGAGVQVERMIHRRTAKTVDDLKAIVRRWRLVGQDETSTEPTGTDVQTDRNGCAGSRRTDVQDRAHPLNPVSEPCNNQTKASASIDGEADTERLGLGCFAGEQAAEQALAESECADPDPSCPEDMTPEQVAEVVTAYPNLRPCVDGSNGGRKTLFNAWRKLCGKLPDALLRQVKRMTAMGVREPEAKAWAARFQNDPGKLSELIDGVLGDGTIRDPAGALIFRLKASSKQDKRPSAAKYTFTQ